MCPWPNCTAFQRNTMRRRRVQARMWCMMREREPSTATPFFTLSSSLAPSMSWWPSPTGFTTMTTRLRSFWTGAGQCSGSRWPPVGCVSSSTCGPSSPPSSAQSALWPSCNITCGLDVAGRKLTLWAERLPQTSLTLKHNPTLPSVFEMEDYLLPFILYASVYFVLQC